MAYVVKTIKGRRYRYQQTSRRVNGKVKTVSVYIGPVDPIYAGPGGPVRPKGSVRARSGGLMRCIFERRRSLPDDAVMLAQYNAKVERDETKFKAGLDKLHTDFGLKMPTVSATGQVVEIEKAPVAEVTAPAEPTDDAKDDDMTPDADLSPTV